MRLHLCCAPDGAPRAAILAPADQKEREVALRLLPLALKGGEAIVCDKGYAGREFAATVAARFGAVVLRPARANEPDNGLHLSGIRQRIESVFWMLKDRLGLEHTARGHWPAYAPESPADYSRSPPASRSTTDSVSQPARSPHSLSDRAEESII